MPHPLLPPEWSPLATEMSGFTLISADAIALLMCEAIATACGNNIQIRDPQWRDLGPAFNFALVSTGLPMPRGALMQLLEPVQDVARHGSDEKELRGWEGLRACSEVLQKGLREVSESLAKEEKELADELFPEGAMARSRSGMSSMAYGNSPSTRIEATRARIKEATQRRAEILAEIDALIFKSRPGILVDEPRFKELPRLGDDSFDRTVMALLFANGPADIHELSAKERTACARTLNGNCDRAGSVLVIMSGNEAAYARVLRSQPIRESGILTNFLFLEVGHGAPEIPSLMSNRGLLERWQQMITRRIEARIAPQKMQHRIYQPDAQGYHAYVDFRRWVQLEMSFARPEAAPFLSTLPDICLKLALARTAMSDEGESLSIPGESVEQCAAFLRELGRRQRELLERLITEQPGEEVFEQQAGRLVQKLERHGPLTMRGLARHCHRQDSQSLEPLLEHGLRHGNIRKQGNLFCATGVSVSASADSHLQK